MRFRRFPALALLSCPPLMLSRCLTSFCAASLVCCSAAQAQEAQEAQIEQARQIDAVVNLAPNVPAPTAPTSLPSESGLDTDSFGVQQLLREKEHLRPFHLYGEASLLYTSNVALSRRRAAGDYFFLPTVGFDVRRSLGRGFEFGVDAKVAAFRYGQYRQLDFESIDAGASLTYHSGQLGGLDLFSRYNFNTLFSSDSGDNFFRNHTLTLGVQKPFVFSAAHYAYVGASGLLGFADPKISERSELSAFTGYHLRATRNLEVDLSYRYSRYLYTEGGREDNNHTLSVGVRYAITKWLSLNASSFLGVNRSNHSVFNYDVINAGGGLSVGWQF